MEDEIPFIRNIEDYENYKKLRPTKIYHRKKVRFICHSCQNESIKGFRSLTPDFLCIHCQARQGTLNASDKFKETCIKNMVLIILEKQNLLLKSINKHV